MKKYIVKKLMSGLTAIAMVAGLMWTGVPVQAATSTTLQLKY